MATKPIVLYGLDGSQPCRTVSWLLRIKKVDFEYVHKMPPKDTQAKEFLQLNPWGTIPVLQHGEGFTLSESAAIITYLAEELGWTDLYPNNKQTRGKIQQWMHWHHRNSREFSLIAFAPLIRADLKISPEKVAAGQSMLKKVAQGLDEALAKSLYLVGDSPTLADFCVFADLGQCHQSEMDLFNFAPYANLDKWMLQMKAQPFYEETHAVLPMLKQMADKAKAKRAAATKAKL
ncbi:hypothetical protein BASA81_016570 [Batrachochytrium salamandrivorans]|nr:hypothetical protein BASA81_016570 [Batrachochytrium salamandrivorans]